MKAGVVAENPGEFLHEEVGEPRARNDDDPLMKGKFSEGGDVRFGVDARAGKGLYLVLSWRFL